MELSLPKFSFVAQNLGGGAAAPPRPPARAPTGKGVNVVPEHGMQKMLIPIHYPASLSGIRRSIA